MDASITMDNYTLEMRDTVIIATRNDGTEQLRFPFSWQPYGRVFSLHNARLIAQDGTDEGLDFETFGTWLVILEELETDT